MSVLGSESRECREKINEPRAREAGSQWGLCPFGGDGFEVAMTGMEGREVNSSRARRAREIPVLLYPPVRSLTIGQTGEI